MTDTLISSSLYPYPYPYPYPFPYPNPNPPETGPKLPLLLSFISYKSVILDVIFFFFIFTSASSSLHLTSNIMAHPPRPHKGKNSFRNSRLYQSYWLRMMGIRRRNTPRCRGKKTRARMVNATPVPLTEVTKCLFKNCFKAISLV